MNIPAEFQGSQALTFIISRGWDWKQTDSIRLELERCPYCGKEGFGHCYFEIHPASHELAKRDGLHMCHHCGKSGNLYSLKQHLGLVIEGVQSRNDWAGEKKIETLPDIEACHKALLEDADAMDYLVNGRGFSKEIIEKQKLGIVDKHYFKKCGEVKALVYPYLVNGNCIFVHYRTLPTMPLSGNKVPKDFSTPKGWDAPLYNGEILREGIKEVVFVEGEANCIAALDKGFANICGVPGANFKKAEWIDTIDKLDLEKIYICYDKDKVGQKAAQTLAARIGIEKCWKVSLPNFTVTTEEGKIRQGKDVNEYFTTEGNVESFKRCIEESVLFDVDGVNNAGDALQEFEDEILNKGVTAKYSPPWPSLAKLVGFDDGDVVDIIAPAKVGKTTFSINLVESLVDTYGEDGVIICLEMTTAKLARKWVSMMAGVPDNIPKTPAEAEELKTNFLAGIKYCRSKIVDRDGDIYFCYPRYSKIDDLYKLIVDIIRRYGVKYIVFDNLQRACDTTIGSKNRTQHLSEISKITSQIAKDYGVVMIRIIQPHQIKEGKLTKSNDADGSSQISKDCDCSMALDRDKVNEITANEFQTVGYIESEATFGDKLLTTVDLSRYSGGGYTTLRFDGATSTVSEYNMADIAKIKADMVKSIGHDAKYQELIAPQEIPI